MEIGKRLRALREERNFSQGDIEKRTGLLRCYTSRVENGHTVPSLETLEKYAQALEIPLYKLFYEGDEPPEMPKLTPRAKIEDIVEEDPVLAKLRRLTKRMDKRSRQLLLYTAQKMAGS